jgi:hypothetical protein
VPPANAAGHLFAEELEVDLLPVEEHRDEQ